MPVAPEWPPATTQEWPLATLHDWQPPESRERAPPFPPRKPRTAVSSQPAVSERIAADRNALHWRLKPGRTEPSFVARLSKLSAMPHHARWAAAGFTAGAIFWHFVGFWTFMSQIMFTSPQAARQATGQTTAKAATLSAQTSPIETGSLQRLEKLTVSKYEASCTAVARDPQTGQTEQSGCRRLAKPLTVKTVSARQGRPASQPRQVQEPQSFDLPKDVPLDWPQTSRAP